MESGINADQNFYLRRPPPPSRDSHQRHDLTLDHHNEAHNLKHDHNHLHPQSQPAYTSSLTSPDFQYTSAQQPTPRLPALTTTNLHAVVTNGFDAGLSAAGEPDEFYREHRGARQSSNGFADLALEGMAAAADARPAPSSLRSNGNGTTPKHPSLPAAQSNTSRPSYRSASAPIDERTARNNAKSSTAALNGLAQSGKPSVKDLLKRFDQNNEQASTPLPKPAPRLVTKVSGTDGPGYMRTRAGHSGRATENSQTTSRAGAATREAGTRAVKSPINNRPTQRTRFVAEDQHSNNSLSGAARASRPKTQVASNSQASRSMTNLSPTAPPAPSQVPARKPLFGEVLGQGDPDVGYGIRRTAARRTSESSLQPSHSRCKSDPDVSPSSPTAWYLGVTPDLEDVDPNKPQTSPAHNRNHSDSADTKVNMMNGVNPDFNYSLSPTSTTHQSKPISRLPVSTRKHSSLSDSDSPVSTRSSSSFSSRIPTKSRKAEKPWSPASRSTTPTDRGAATPTRHSPKDRGLAAHHTKNVKAFISAPATKTSPPLRSSRPRQTISTASSTSPRHKAAEATATPLQNGAGVRGAGKSGADEHKQRKIADIGPVDFAARRAKIQRAYTRSIHESEQKEIRAANLRRLSERHASYVAEKQETAEAALSEVSPNTTDTAPLLRYENSIQVESPVQNEDIHVKPLQISTSFSRSPETKNDDAAAYVDSPTLGMPGTFIDDVETPASAISNATRVTEFDNEPQTEPAHEQEHLRPEEPIKPRPMSSVIIEWDDLSPEQASFGVGQSAAATEQGSIQSILDAVPTMETLSEKIPYLRDRQERDPAPPGAFRRDSEFIDFNQPGFNIMLEEASPIVATLADSRPTTPFHAEGSQHSGEDDQGLDESSRTPQNRPPPDILFHPDYEYFTPGAPTLPIEPETDHSVLFPPPLVVHDVHDFLSAPASIAGYESSEGDGLAQSSGPEQFENEYDPHRPEQGTHTQRTSHQSAWTDYSVDTTDEASETEDHAYDPATISGAEQTLVSPSSNATSVQHLPDLSTSQQPTSFADSSPRVVSPPRRKAVQSTIIDSTSKVIPERLSRLDGPPTLWPDYSHATSPVAHSVEDASPVQPLRSPPPPNFYNKRPTSSVYPSSQNSTNRNTESRRPSDDTNSPRPSSSTPRSSTQVSLEDVTPQPVKPKDESLMTEEEKKAAEELKQKLFKRRMTIKELIDTEAVYLKDMNVVEEIYKGTAEACPKLDAGDVKTIFRNTDEIIAFSSMFLDELKSAGSSVYSPRANRSKQLQTPTDTLSASSAQTPEDRGTLTASQTNESDELKDRKTFIGATFSKHLPRMQAVYTDFLKNSETATARLTTLQHDAAVKVWLNECNQVAKDLTAAWDLDALLVKPVQRVTRYQLFLVQMSKELPEDHPDHQALQAASREVGVLLKNIDDLKKRIHMVGKIVNRKRKESDVRSGIAKAFGRRAEKLQSSHVNRPQEDEVYVKLHEKFADDFLRLQVVLRDVEFYTRQIRIYVNDFLKYLSAMELVMRTSASPYPELESKWAQFNMSMRDIGTIALEDHIEAVRRSVIVPFERVIESYGPPGLAMKKRAKRRLDYEKSLQLKGQGKKVDEKLGELVDQYEALNETLKLELPKLSSMTETIGNISLVQFVNIQAQWFGIWQDKIRYVLEDNQVPKDADDIVDMFKRDFRYVDARIQELGIINGSFLQSGRTPRISQSTGTDDSSSRSKGRPSNFSSRSRGLSFNSDQSPSLPTPDFAKRHSGQFNLSPLASTPASSNIYPTPSSANGPSQPFMHGHSRTGSGSPATLDPLSGTRPHVSNNQRPNTGRSMASDGGPSRPSNDYSHQPRRESGSTYTSSSHHVDGPPLPSTSRPYSGLFHSAMPLPDGPEESQRSSGASSRDRTNYDGYNVLYLAASLFEFNISATKSEAGYPYLTYQAGEIFDVIGEKGELWLAKNQDDPSDQVGWIWSKHFARLATD